MRPFAFLGANLVLRRVDLLRSLGQVRGTAAALLGLILPSSCVVCVAPGEALCESCRGRLARIEGPVCERCGAPTAWPVERCRECAGRRIAFASARAAVAYDDAARRLVAGWKERGLRELAVLAAELVGEAVPRPPVYALVAGSRTLVFVD